MIYLDTKVALVKVYLLNYYVQLLAIPNQSQPTSPVMMLSLCQVMNLNILTSKKSRPQRRSRQKMSKKHVAKEVRNIPWTMTEEISLC